MKTKLTILLIMTFCFIRPSLSYSQNWLLLGNGTTTYGTNFIGTTNDVDLMFKVDDIVSGRVEEEIVGNGCTSLGVNTLIKSPVSDEENDAFGYLALQNSQGYDNDAMGVAALNANTTGGWNVAIGDVVLESNTTGSWNTGLGAQSLNTNSTGSYNVAVGYRSLFDNTVGYNNAFGYEALYTNSTGTPNHGFGYQALYSNTTGSDNSAFGYQALYSNTTGAFNIGIGDSVLFTNSTGTENTAAGDGALYKNTGSSNTAIGYQALNKNTTGYVNTAVGMFALDDNTTSAGLTAVGYEALPNNTGSNNDAFGYRALYSNTSGSPDQAFGYGALYNNTGSNNVAMGYEAGYSNTTGSQNVFIGLLTGSASQTTGSNNTFIGYNATANGNYSNSTAIGNGAQITASNVVVLGNSAVTAAYVYTAKITTTSDGRFKKNIAPNVVGLPFINKLKPITYNYDIESLDEYTHGSKLSYSPDQLISVKAKENTVYSGFVAQDVEAAAKSVGYNFGGVYTPQNDHDTYGLAYSDFVVPLVKAVQELSAKNDIKDSIIIQQQQQLIAQQSQLDQISAMVSKLDLALSQCCTNYQSTSGSSPSTGTQNNPVPSLNQNVPNPFSQNTIISCYVPITSQSASIIIYNLDGQTLKTFVVGTTGFNEVTITAGTLAAGNYLYTLIVDGQRIDTKTMTLTH